MMSIDYSPLSVEGGVVKQSVSLLILHVGRCSFPKTERERERCRNVARRLPWQSSHVDPTPIGQKNKPASFSQQT